MRCRKSQKQSYHSVLSILLAAIRKATLHHLHPIVVELSLFLLILRIGKGLFLSALAALTDAVVGQESEEDDKTCNGA